MPQLRCEPHRVELSLQKWSVGERLLCVHSERVSIVYAYSQLRMLGIVFSALRREVLLVGFELCQTLSLLLIKGRPKTFLCLLYLSQ